MWILRFLMLLALIVWIGSIIFFAFVVAPTLFTVLPDPHTAGQVVGPTLAKLHYIGLIAGVAFLFCSLTYNRLWSGRPRLRSATHILIVLMLVMTAISQFGVTPRIRTLRSDLSNGSPIARADFDRLHNWSTRLEGGVLVLGLGVVILTARRFGAARS